MKKSFFVASTLFILLSCNEVEELAEAVASMDCYCVGVEYYYPISILDECDYGYTMECIPLGETPNF